MKGLKKWTHRVKSDDKRHVIGNVNKSIHNEGRSGVRVLEPENQ